MGTTYTTRCSCGYDTKLHLGNGLGSFDTHMAIRLFGAAVFAEYEKKKKEDTMFLLGNELCICPNCKKLLAQATFTYTNAIGKKIKIILPCSQCGHIPTLTKEPVCCPKCGKELKLVQTGYWD